MARHPHEQDDKPATHEYSRGPNSHPDKVEATAVPPAPSQMPAPVDPNIVMSQCRDDFKIATDMLSDLAAVLQRIGNRLGLP